MTAHIVVVGDLVTDVVAVLAGPLAEDSDTPARIRVTGGGQAANTAAWLAWAARERDRGSGPDAEPAGGRGDAPEPGSNPDPVSTMAPVTLVAAAGADDAGRDRVAELRALGVRCAVTHRPGVGTGAIVVLARGERRTMVTDRGANLTLTADDVDAALAAAPQASHLHLSAYTLLDPASRGAGLRALSAARERGLTTSVDAASAAPLRQVGVAAFTEWVRGTDLLLANGDEATVLATGAAFGGLTAACGLDRTVSSPESPSEPGAHPEPGAPTTAVSIGAVSTGAPATETLDVGRLVRVALVIKRGASGAIWLGADGGSAETPATPVDAVDPTGAGDAFAAGLLAAWTAGATPAEALRAGARLGALAVCQVGARPRR